MTDSPAAGATRPRALLVDRDPVFRTSLTAFHHRRGRLRRGETASPLNLATSALCRRPLPTGPYDGGGVAEARHRRDAALQVASLAARREPAWAERPAFLRSAPQLRKPIDFEELASVAQLLLLPETPPPPGRRRLAGPRGTAPLSVPSASVYGRHERSRGWNPRHREKI